MSRRATRPAAADAAARRLPPRRRPRTRILQPIVAFFALVVLDGPGCAAPAIDFGTSNVSAPGAVTGMDHILLTVSDMSRSVGFYRDVMGMRLEYRSLHFAMLRAGNYGVALSTRPWPFERKGEPKGIGMIPHFTTTDIDAFATRLKKNGVSWLRAPVRESFGIEAFVTDPDGYQWAVLAPLDAHAAE